MHSERRPSLPFRTSDLFWIYVQKLIFAWLENANTKHDLIPAIAHEVVRTVLATASSFAMLACSLPTILEVYQMSICRANRVIRIFGLVDRAFFE